MIYQSRMYCLASYCCCSELQLSFISCASLRKEWTARARRGWHALFVFPVIYLLPNSQKLTTRAGMSSPSSYGNRELLRLLLPFSSKCLKKKRLSVLFTGRLPTKNKKKKVLHTARIIIAISAVMVRKHPISPSSTNIS